LRRLTSEADLRELSVDAGMISLRPRAGYLAESEREVVSAVDEALRDGIPLTPRGAGTSIPSQAVGTGIVLLQQRRDATLSGALGVACGPALVKSDLNGELDPRGLWMPVDPSSYKSCTVGGMTSNNSAGVRTPKYGSTIDFVERLRAVIPGEGAKEIVPLALEDALAGDARTRMVASLILENQKEIISERPRVTKNSSGYRLERVVHDGLFDLPKLFVGSEGTLGVITEVTFRVLQKPRSRVMFVAESELEGLGDLVSAFREHAPSAVELIDKSVFAKVGKEEMVSPYSRSDLDYLVFAEFDGSEEEVMSKLDDVAGSRAAGYDPVVLGSQSEITKVLEVRSETLARAQEIREGGRVVVPGVEDLVVPPERLDDLVKLLRDQFERRGLGYISYGHAADANLHARPFLDPGSADDMKTLGELMEECFEAVWRMGGSMTGEHGDGMLRAKYVPRQYPITYQIMKAVKEAYDPKGILNPRVKIAWPGPP
jgi:FAD/FMN-containing dehydrogenase